jgi:hypothetical protein
MPTTKSCPIAGNNVDGPVVPTGYGVQTLTFNVRFGLRFAAEAKLFDFGKSSRAWFLTFFCNSFRRHMDYFLFVGTVGSKVHFSVLLPKQ